MIIFRFVVTFEDVDDVERVIDIRAGQTLRDLHTAILESVGFKPDTPASIYLASDNWRKGKRFSDREVNVDDECLMSENKLNVVVNNPHQRFLYFTDDDTSWELKVELLRIYKSEAAIQFPNLVKAIGSNPKQFVIKVIGAPTNQFEQLVDELMTEDPHELSDTTEEREAGDGGEEDSESQE